MHDRGSVVGRGSVDNRGSVNHRSSVICRSGGVVDYWRHWAIGWSGMVDRMVNSMRHRMVDGMGNRMMHSVWHRVVDSVGHRVGNMVGNGVGNMTMVGNRVGNKAMVGNRVGEVGNLLDERAGRGCSQQRGDDESLEKNLLSVLLVISHLVEWLKFPIGVSKSLHIHTISLYLHFVLSRGAEVD